MFGVSPGDEDTRDSSGCPAPPSSAVQLRPPGRLGVQRNRGRVSRPRLVNNVWPAINRLDLLVQIA
jgi:hypothetical protein